MLDPGAIMEAGATRVELRGPSGRLYGILDRRTLILEVKRKGEPPEQIDLRPLLQIEDLRAPRAPRS